MNNGFQFPQDTNGDVLRRMYAGGDDLTQQRSVDFCFIFSERGAALAFAEIIDARDKKVCIGYYKARAMWEVVVKHSMAPSYKNITAMEAALTEKANSVGGRADGWGCMRMLRKEQGL